MKFVVFELFILFLFYYHEIERGVDKIRGNKKCKDWYDMFKKVFSNVDNFIKSVHLNRVQKPTYLL